MDDESPTPLEETRPPSVEDLTRLANSLNELGAKYIVIGGFAIIAAGYTRATMDIDLLVDTSPENDAKVRDALADLPDRFKCPSRRRFTTAAATPVGFHSMSTGTPYLAAVSRMSFASQARRSISSPKSAPNSA